MAQSEELAIEFYPPGGAEGLADCLLRLLEDPQKQYAMAMQNFSAALRMTMPNVVQKYLRHFELQQRVETLKYVSRVRRLPQWMPSKSLLLRLLTRNSLSWARRSVILHTPWEDISRLELLNGNGNGRGKMNGSHAPVDGTGKTLSNGGRPDGAAASTAGDGADNHHGRNAPAHGSDNLSAIHPSHPDSAEQAQPEQTIGQVKGANFAVIRGGDRHFSSDSQDGTGRSRTRNDRTGTE
jgi:hypothetical protein